MVQNTLTLIGTLSSDVTMALDDVGKVARFRLVLRSRRVNPETHTWTVADRTLLTVTCRKRLATNVAASIRRGDPVIVTGALRTRRTDGRSPRIELEAFTVGLDLGRTALPESRDNAA